MVSSYNGPKMEKPAGNKHHRPVARRNKMVTHLIFLSLMVVAVTIKVKIIVRRRQGTGLAHPGAFAARQPDRRLTRAAADSAPTVC